MAFRQPKSRRDVADRQWRQWLAAHAAALTEAGLPPGVTLSESHWNDFLANGYMELHPEADDGFWFGDLTPRQMAALLAVLKSTPAYVGVAMAGWLQHRLGGEARSDPSE